MEERIRKVISQMASRKMEATYFETLREAAEAIMEAIPGSATVGIGNSQTLKMMDISRRLSERGNIVYDKTLAGSGPEMEGLKKKSLTADWFLTIEGQMVPGRMKVFLVGEEAGF